MKVSNTIPFYRQGERSWRTWDFIVIFFMVHTGILPDDKTLAAAIFGRDATQVRNRSMLLVRKRWVCGFESSSVRSSYTNSCCRPGCLSWGYWACCGWSWGAGPPLGRIDWLDGRRWSSQRWWRCSRAENRRCRSPTVVLRAYWRPWVSQKFVSAFDASAMLLFA